MRPMTMVLIVALGAVPSPFTATLTRKTYSGPLVAGEDLMTIGIGDRIQVHKP